MLIEGTWWFLVDEEPFDADRTQQLRFEHGSLIDAPSEQRIGSYTVEGDKLTATFEGSRGKILATVRQDPPLLMSANLVEELADGGSHCSPVLLTRAEAVVLPLFPDLAAA